MNIRNRNLLQLIVITLILTASLMMLLYLSRAVDKERDTSVIDDPIREDSSATDYFDVTELN